MAAFNRKTTGRLKFKMPKGNTVKLSLLDLRRFPRPGTFLFIPLVTNLLSARLLRILYRIYRLHFMRKAYRKWADERWCMCGECRMMTSFRFIDILRHMHTYTKRHSHTHFVTVGYLYFPTMDRFTGILIGFAIETATTVNRSPDFHFALSRIKSVELCFVCIWNYNLATEWTNGTFDSYVWGINNVAMECRQFTSSSVKKSNAIVLC